MSWVFEMWLELLVFISFCFYFLLFFYSTLFCFILFYFSSCFCDLLSGCFIDFIRVSIRIMISILFLCSKRSAISDTAVYLCLLHQLRAILFIM